MSERIEVGKVCEKGHASWEGESDHGICGSHYYATIYLTIEEDWTPYLRDKVSTEQVTEELEKIVRDAEAHRWCGSGE